MTIGLSDEQKLLSESVSRFMTDRYEFNTRRRIVAEDPGFSSEHWTEMAELGWLALPFDQADGGLGGSIRDLTVLAEGLGKALYVSPFLSSVVLAGGLVAELGSKTQKADLLPPLMEGRTHLAFAFAEPQSRYDLFDIKTSARATGSEHRLDGAKSVVLHAGVANHFIVSARTGGEQRSETGVSLFVVAADAEGLAVRAYPTVDDHRAAEVTFAETPGTLLGPLHGAGPHIERASDTACLVLSAEAVGCMGTLYERTLDYVKQREQFGAALGSFQAIQHRMVDVFMAYEQARSLTYAAAHRFDGEPGDAVRAQLASAAKLEIAKAGRHIGQEAIQLHGGMGMTDELPIGHYFKRLTAINATLGDRHHHLQRFKRLGS